MMISPPTEFTHHHRNWAVTQTVRRCVCSVGTCSVELCGSLEEAWQCCLQDHDEVLQLLRHSHQQVLIHQVVLGLFQSPFTAHIPAHKQHRDYHCCVNDQTFLPSLPPARHCSPPGSHQKRGEEEELHAINQDIK